MSLAKHKVGTYKMLASYKARQTTTHARLRPHKAIPNPLKLTNPAALFWMCVKSVLTEHLLSKKNNYAEFQVNRTYSFEDLVMSQSVLLLEAGGDEPTASTVPGFYRNYWNNPEVDWMYRTQPQEDVCIDQGDQGCMWPRGKMLGGTSVLNGMMYHRGHKADYDDWVRLYNATGWSWDEVRPFFDKSEDNKQMGTVVSEKDHGAGGQGLKRYLMSKPSYLYIFFQFKHQPKLIFDILDAVQEAGFPVVSDMNDPNADGGFAIAQAFNHNGSRYSTSRAFLRPASDRTNLDVTLRAHVSRLLFDGDQVMGVEYLRGGETHVVQVTKEVILSAGALNTPQILLLSGIGPKETLKKHDIHVVADLANVGQNLRNHLGVNFYFIMEKDKNTRILDWSVATKYLLNREGIMSSTGITQVAHKECESVGNVSLLKCERNTLYYCGIRSGVTTAWRSTLTPF
ncbi:Glucose dehydrogenase [Eumeta japonica]|uniref:Glucose dehydrogenase n=1 Tax=Eumeta variegata TaxID=151549 RepID=A0A4C1XD72_EUMVA|nr:Glucose dehydrogenase [Eumeta japonica]